jgi:hypothetical protein
MVYWRYSSPLLNLSTPPLARKTAMKPAAVAVCAVAAKRQYKSLRNKQY